MKHAVVSVTAALLVLAGNRPAPAQAPLTVGSVRDQEGRPIEGATVTVVRPAGSTISGQTDRAGTFALTAGGIASLKVTCRYCEATVVAVRADEPVVAIVRRYLALSDGVPSPADLAALPYAHVESAIALRPFTLLASSSTPYPGSRVSDRGLSSIGSLLVDNGAPNYDITNGQSPFALIPANYERSAVVHDATNAFLYGDQSAGGIVELEPFNTGTNAEIATVGSSTIARAQVGSDSFGLVAGSSSNNAESRQRADLFQSWSLDADQTFGVAAGSEQGRSFQSPGSSFAGSYSFGDASFHDPRALNLYVSAVTDRGGYTMSAGEYPISAGWSDTGFAAGIHSNGALSGFADVGVRSSTGYYDAQALPFGLPRVGATLVQSRADAGFATAAEDYDIVAGLGAFWINYAGGTLGVSQPAKTAFVLPSVNAVVFPNGKFSADFQGSGSFTLPALVDQYQYSGGLPMPVGYQRNALGAVSFTYTDDSRVRLSFEEADESSHGVWTGTVTSTGFSAVWQVAPTLALRAWTMHVRDTVQLYGGGYPYGGAAPTVNAAWLTYDPAAGLRMDAIYRRDLLDGAPFYHFDGAISAPIRSGVRWYAGVESWMHRTFIDAGLRIGGP
ncbi:MAG: carboxypeptidase regulatory-like domain-containing protein [Candidatus Eremiobacteraeota bacterium]|nr:carboxypeptidase regulatory-like domain-containing protein [Candidatus Eremiobacteraeota bacterium]MBV9263339.1 carboxypeptidase regulatory-like domain-containing protein [Candidatus Eremiobacteraeota bacterium]